MSACVHEAADGARRPTESSGSRWLRALRRRPRWILLGLGAGLWFFFPSLRRHDLEIRARGPRECPAMVKVEISREDTLVRGFKVRLRKDGRIEHEVALSAGSYLMRSSLTCDDEAESEVVSQPVIVDRSGYVEVEIGARCPCSTPSAPSTP